MTVFKMPISFSQLSNESVQGAHFIVASDLQITVFKMLISSSHLTFKWQCLRCSFHFRIWYSNDSVHSSRCSFHCRMTFSFIITSPGHQLSRTHLQVSQQIILHAILDLARVGRARECRQSWQRLIICRRQNHSDSQIKRRAKIQKSNNGENMTRTSRCQH